MDLRPIVRRYGPGGQLLWTYSLPGQAITRAVHGRELTDGELIVTGLSGPATPSAIEVLCMRFSAGGVPEATQTLGTGGFQQGLKVLERSAGGSMIFGKQDSPVNGVVLHVDDQCVLQTERYHPGLALYDACLDPATDSYYTTGHRDGFCLVARFDEAGDTVWTRTYAPGIGRFIRPDGHGGFLITGQAAETVGGAPPQPYLLRVDGNGSMTGIVEALSGIALAELLGTGGTHGAVISVATPCTWSLLDATGRLMDEGRIAQAGRASIPASRSKGPALLHLRDGDGRMQVLRWVVP
jgi:hypothetical protein